jgi:hypothetical protein
MVCELALTFEQKDFAMSGELVSRGSTRNTAAHDNEIISIHSQRSGYASAKTLTLLSATVRAIRPDPIECSALTSLIPDAPQSGKPAKSLLRLAIDEYLAIREKPSAVDLPQLAFVMTSAENRRLAVLG